MSPVPDPAAPPALIAALLRSLSPRCGRGGVQWIETHISWVLLAGPYAYKIKKPLKLSFLDFSSLPQRRSACEEELRLNRRFAPQLYLEVVPIGGSIDGPVLGGEGPAFEYAVKMHRFPQEQQLDRLLDAGRLWPQDLEGFGHALASLHAALPAASMASAYGSPAQVHAPVSASLRELLEGTASREQADQLHEIGARLNRSYAALLPLLSLRKRDGCIRECHGDLHLANLVKLDQGIVPFDCIEFSPELRWIDVLSDAAFLMMDLVQRRKRQLAYAFLNAYLESTGDYAGTGLLHYYAAYRALVRAKVAMIRGRHGAQVLQQEQAAVCAGYIRQALDWTCRSRPGLVLMHGFSGSGKTRYSAGLAEALPAIRLRSDVERKRLHGVAMQARSDSTLGGGLYTASASERVYAHLAELARQIVEGGETALVDATFLSAAERQRFAGLAQRLGVPLATVDCRAPAAELERRVAQRAAESGDASEAGVEVLRHQLTHHDPLSGEELQRTLPVDTTVPPSGEALAEELRQLLEAEPPG